MEKMNSREENNERQINVLFILFPPDSFYKFGPVFGVLQGILSMDKPHSIRTTEFGSEAYLIVPNCIQS